MYLVALLNDSMLVFGSKMDFPDPDSSLEKHMHLFSFDIISSLIRGSGTIIKDKEVK